MKRERREKSGSQGRSPGQPRGKGGGRNQGDRELEGKEGEIREPGEKSRAAKREGGREKSGR